MGGARLNIMVTTRSIEQMRAVHEENLARSGPDCAFYTAGAALEGTARFLEARLGTAQAYRLVQEAADRIVERGAAGLAVPVPGDSCQRSVIRRGLMGRVRRFLWGEW